MTFYEELGVPPDAPLDTIREAYRNVARLLHPDAQTNPVLKESAEAQMKRINHLYETLSDPKRRRRYDLEQSEAAGRSAPLIIQAARLPDQRQRGITGTYAWLAATAICAAFIIWLATRESSVPAVYPQPVGGENAGASAPSSKAPSALRRSAADREIARLRAELAAASADRQRLTQQIAAMQAERKFQPPTVDPGQPTRVALLPLPMPLPAQAIPLDIPVPARTELAPPQRPRWSGAWVYNQQHRDEKGSKGLFPPEFIETSISEVNGHIRGQYHARFKVADVHISPDVDFRFDGMVSGMSGRCSWTGTGGAKGEVELRMLSDAALEIIWAATDLGKSMGLASGTAVLNRKN
jgi:curved DNA-binding protein CbpA